MPQCAAFDTVKSIEVQTIAGIHPVLAALKSGQSIDRVSIAKGAGGPRLQEIIDLCRERNVTVRFETREALDRASRAAVHQGVLASQLASHTAEQLRDNNLRVLLHCGGGSFKSQMKKADASGARVALVIGDDEAQANEVSVKPMQGGEQVRVSAQNLIAAVKQFIKQE